MDHARLAQVHVALCVEFADHQADGLLTLHSGEAQLSTAEPSKRMATSACTIMHTQLSAVLCVAGRLKPRQIEQSGS